MKLDPPIKFHGRPRKWWQRIDARTSQST